MWDRDVTADLSRRRDYFQISISLWSCIRLKDAPFDERRSIYVITEHWVKTACFRYSILGDPLIFGIFRTASSPVNPHKTFMLRPHNAEVRNTRITEWIVKFWWTNSSIPTYPQQSLLRKVLSLIWCVMWENFWRKNKANNSRHKTFVDSPNGKC
jgi:hypothetical protein